MASHRVQAFLTILGKPVRPCEIFHPDTSMILLPDDLEFNAEYRGLWCVYILFLHYVFFVHYVITRIASSASGMQHVPVSLFSSRCVP